MGPHSPQAPAPKVKLMSSSHRDLDRRDLHGVADLLQAAHQARGRLVRVGAVEVSGAEVMPWSMVVQHVPDRGEHRGGHGEDGLLGAAPGAQAMELRLQVAVLDAHRGPGSLHQGRLEPGTSAPHPGAAAFAGSLNAKCLPLPKMTSLGAAQLAQCHVPDSITTLRLRRTTGHLEKPPGRWHDVADVEGMRMWR